jgi:hypothetical protein
MTTRNVLQKHAFRNPTRERVGGFFVPQMTVAPLVELAPSGLDMSEFEGAFKEVIPCEHCREPATLRSFGHVDGDCGAGPADPGPPYYKCQDCYMAWRDRVKAEIRYDDGAKCLTCKRVFSTPESFSNYRRF